MDKRLIAIVLGVAVLAAVGGWYAWARRDTAAFDVPAENVQSVQEGSGGVASEKPSPVSLPALMERQYDGRDLKLGSVLTQTPAYTRYAITYKSGDLTISGIMNIPTGPGPFPVIIANHGYIDPDVYTTGRGLRREQEYLARNGYAVLHPDYRNHAGSDKDISSELEVRIGYIVDVINAVYAVRTADIAALDRERIGMLGHSMGGGIAEGVMIVRPDLVDAYVLFAPVSMNPADSFNRWLKQRPGVARVVESLFGAPTDDSPFWRSINGERFISRISDPVMIHHGDADRDVPVEWSQRTAQLLQDAGKEVTLHVYPDQPHEFTIAWPQVMERTVTFFNEKVKK